MIGRQEIDNRFGHHRATLEGPNATLPRHQDLRRLFAAVATQLDATLPDGREKSLVFTKLEEASMWSHKAVASKAPLEENAARADQLFKEDED